MDESRSQRYSDGMDAVEQVLRSFGVNLAREGAQDMVEFAAWCAMCGGSGEAMQRMAEAHGVYYLALNSRMKGACKPVLQATDEELQAAGLRLIKRNAYALGAALAAKCF